MPFRKWNIRKHMLVHKTFRCSFCNEVFNLKGHLSYHIGKVHRFKCSQFNFECSKQRILKRHNLKKHIEGSILCTMCPFKTNFERRLEEHNMKKHTAKVNWYKCSECEFRAWSKTGVKVHTNKIHLGIRFHCWLCNSKFTQKPNINVHMKTLHPHGCF